MPGVAPELAHEPLRPLLWREYDRLVDLGTFDEDERIELLCGFLVAMSPQRERHAYCITQLTRLLVPAVGNRALVRVQLPLAVSADSEPEPDISVVAPGDYLDGHPKTANIVIEVADESLHRDLGIKARLYAAAGVPEYWVVDLKHGRIEAHSSVSEGRYARIRRHTRGETLRLHAFPGVRLRIDDALPPLRSKTK